MTTTLLEFQQRVGAISKDATNPFFKSSYFDINSLLAEVKPLLSELQITVNQPLTTIDGKPAIRTVLTTFEGKELFNDAIVLPDLQDPQKMGSAITYYRRYSLQSLLALEAVDDDANTASNKVITPSAKQDYNVIKTTTITPKVNPINNTASTHAQSMYAGMAQAKDIKVEPYVANQKYPAKIEGQLCLDCGGTYIKSHASGKIFCSNKCWLPENAHLKSQKIAKEQANALEVELPGDLPHF